jgi:hypothetical protein
MELWKLQQHVQTKFLGTQGNRILILLIFCDFFLIFQLWIGEYEELATLKGVRVS